MRSNLSSIDRPHGSLIWPPFAAQGLPADPGGRGCLGRSVRRQAHPGLRRCLVVAGEHADVRTSDHEWRICCRRRADREERRFEQRVSLPVCADSWCPLEIDSQKPPQQYSAFTSFAEADSSFAARPLCRCPSRRRWGRNVTPQSLLCRGGVGLQGRPRIGTLSSSGI